MPYRAIHDRARALQGDLVHLRRALHRLAEPGGREEKTCAYLLQQIDQLGLPVQRVGAHGLLAVLDSGRPGPGIALRADIDALPMAEDACNLAHTRPVCSDDPAACHACGHDAHMAMLLGAMRLLCAQRDHLCGRVYFCFEEGEENHVGYAAMLQALSEHAVDTVWALHVYAALPSGMLSMAPGASMAGFAGVDLTVHGRGGHGSRPDLSVNPVFAAAGMLPNLASAFANQIDAEETVTLGITSIRGGEVFNVIPDEATVLGSLRFFSLQEGEKALRILRSVCDHTAAMHNCTVTYSPRTALLLPPVANHPAACALAEDAVARTLGQQVLTRAPHWYASETFAHYQQRYPGVLAFLGIANPEKGTGAQHHNARFDVDEDVLWQGAAASAAYALACMQADPAAWTITQMGENT